MICKSVLEENLSYKKIKLGVEGNNNGSNSMEAYNRSSKTIVKFSQICITVVTSSSEYGLRTFQSANMSNLDLDSTCIFLRVVWDVKVLTFCVYMFDIPTNLCRHFFKD